MTPTNSTPANPAQVTERAILALKLRQIPTTNIGDAAVIGEAADALAAIGAGGQAVAWRISCPDDEIYGRGPDTLRFHPLSSDEIASGYTQQPLFSNPPAQPGWRDMSSAPKDGTRILVVGHRGNQMDIAEWGNGRFLGRVKGYEKGWTCVPGHTIEPTRWMPLPADPPPGGAK